MWAMASLPQTSSRAGAPTGVSCTILGVIMASAVVRTAGDRPPGLDQRPSHVGGRPQERDARAVGNLDRPLEQASAQTLEPSDIRLEVRRVEAEVLEAVMRAGITRAEPLTRARPRD